VSPFQTLPTLSFRAERSAAEKSCDGSRIHSHVILECNEEVRGSTLFTTLLPLPAAKISPFRYTSVEMTRNKAFSKWQGKKKCRTSSAKASRMTAQKCYSIFPPQRLHSKHITSTELTYHAPLGAYHIAALDPSVTLRMTICGNI
jgi:hypothetical protein